VPQSSFCEGGFDLDTMGTTEEVLPATVGVELA
jgi:hypothetical protein